MENNGIIDEILKSDTKTFKKKDVPDTPEKYLLKRIIDLEEELEMTKKAYIEMRASYIRKLEIQKDHVEEKVVNFEMLRFLWDNVIVRYDDETCTVMAVVSNVKVPGRLQDAFHLWQSFKDNPEGGGV